MSDLHLFGIRHHGPGSAQSLVKALHALEPDIVLVEGPADANDVIPLLADPDMEPPVSLLVYRPDQPRRSVYIPFAIFSPELQALRYALSKGIAARFFDLPQAYQLAEAPKKPEEGEKPLMAYSHEALKTMAEAAGYDDYESWWNRVIEQRRDHQDVFDAIFRVMTVLRDEAEMMAMGNPTTAHDLREARREAFMRRCVRQARKDGYKRIAIVCGAWHTPAIERATTAKADNLLLKGLKKVKVEATWVPWTYGRLANQSGYGAGIKSPGWYQHLWEMGQAERTPTDMGIYWLTRVASLLRGEDLDASSAHIIETVRLAEALAILRERPLPGLDDYNEATQTIMCFGDAKPMQLIWKELIVGERMGSVPPDTPMVPLQRDLARLQRRLRLKPDPESSTHTFDLRKPMHLKRSHLLHRLDLLNIPWGVSEPPKESKGTYLEIWRLQWRPDFVVLLIEASMYGTTVEEAATEFAKEKVEQATQLPELTSLLNHVLLADLPDVLPPIMKRLEGVSALSSDIGHMMDALPPLVRVLRYGSVRQTNRELVQQVVDSLLKRIFIGLPHACRNLKDEAAQELYGRLLRTHGLLRTLRQPEHREAWHDMLTVLVDQQDLHGLIAGRTCRLLYDDQVFAREQVTQRMELVLSVTKTPNAAADDLVAAGNWIEGFLKDSGLILIHDDGLWQILDDWLLALGEDDFIGQLPLLRRTFSTFSDAERQQLKERAKRGSVQQAKAEQKARFDEKQADKVLPLVAQLLGIKS